MGAFISSGAFPDAPSLKEERRKTLVIKSFLNLCLQLFLDLLAHIVAIAAAFGVAWATVCGARWTFRKFTTTVAALKARQARKETHAHVTR